MGLEILDSAAIILALEVFLDNNRPPVEIRHKIDIGYRLEKQSIFLFEIRPDWIMPEVINQLDFAKATFVKSNGNWKVFWVRGNGKWYPYSLAGNISSIQDVLKIIELDEHGCFKG